TEFHHGIERPIDYPTEAGFEAIVRSTDCAVGWSGVTRRAGCFVENGSEALGYGFDLREFVLAVLEGCKLLRGQYWQRITDGSRLPREKAGGQDTRAEDDDCRSHHTAPFFS